MTLSLSQFRRLLAISSLALMSAACAAVGPNYQRPPVSLTAHYLAAPSPAAPAHDQDLEAWWQAFDDPMLERVVERAMAQNLDLEAARGRVLSSRAAAAGAGAAMLPTLDASGDAGEQSISLLSPIGDLARNLPGFRRQTGLYDLGAAASWEIDLFGGLRRQREAAQAQAHAAQADAIAVRLSVAAEAADAYLQIRAYQARLAVARRQQGIEEDLVSLVTRRAAQGVAADRELRQTRAELEGVNATIPPLGAGLDGQYNRLDVLMGAQPGTWRGELAAPAPIPAAPTLRPGDGPADLLRRRPDVMAAEQRLIAANAAIGAAIADYYPKVSISGLLGVESIAPGQLFVADAVQQQIGAGLRWRLFDFGRVDAEVAGARGGKAQALAAWRASILRATGEVEDAFADLSSQEERARDLERQVGELTVARAQAQQAYAGGVLSLIEVRDADRDLLSASDQLVQARAGACRAAIEAYRSLGGGWRPPTSSGPVARLSLGGNLS
jgi:NodT family efflux transporter outer membrane factor (OMF) lipoprotein